MADKIPLKAKFNGSDTTALSEFESGDTLSTSLLDTGTGASQLVQLDSSSRLPAVDGSQLTGIDGLPSQSGQTGKYLTTNGSVASWGTVASGGVNITSNATAPSSPSVGDQWYDTANGVLYVRVTDGTDVAWLDISSANGTAAASAGGGGAWEVVSSTVVTSAVASVEFALSGYKTFKIIYENVNNSSTGSQINLIAVLSSDSGASYLSSGYATFTSILQPNYAGFYQTNSASSTSICCAVNVGGGASHSVSGEMTLHATTESSDIKHITGSYSAASSMLSGGTFHGQLNNTSVAINQIKLYFPAKNITEGTFTLYGIKTS